MRLKSTSEHRNMPLLLGRQKNKVKIIILPKILYRFNASQIKISIANLTEQDVNPKTYMELEEMQSIKKSCQQEQSKGGHDT